MRSLFKAVIELFEVMLLFGALLINLIKLLVALPLLLSTLGEASKQFKFYALLFKVSIKIVINKRDKDS